MEQEITSKNLSVLVLIDNFKKFQNKRKIERLLKLRAKTILERLRFARIFYKSNFSALVSNHFRTDKSAGNFHSSKIRADPSRSVLNLCSSFIRFQVRDRLLKQHFTFPPSIKFWEWLLPCSCWSFSNLSTYLDIGNCSNLSPWIVNGYQACQGGSIDSVIIYDDFEFQSTIATEFDLVCDQQYKVRRIN